jgi:hypothetical protein
VDALTKSIDISNDLFKYARADYMEVLLTQRDALESKFELVEKKVNQLKASVAVYRALGGGWDQNLPLHQMLLLTNTLLLFQIKGVYRKITPFLFKTNQSLNRY